jgi:hypothetical protein
MQKLIADGNAHEALALVGSLSQQVPLQIVGMGR